MKNWILVSLPILFATWVLSVFEWQLAVLLLSGFILAFFSDAKGVFWKAFVVQAVVSLFMYMLYSEENAFAGNIAGAIGMPGVLFPVLVMVVNGFTAAFALQIGISVKNLMQ